MIRITDKKMKCPKCNLVIKTIDCLVEGEITPDDDDGHLCCPRCWFVMREKSNVKILET